MSTSVVNSSHVFEIELSKMDVSVLPVKSRITLKEIQKSSRESLRKAPSFIAVLKQGFKIFSTHCQKK